MVEETGKRVLDLINELYHGNFIDEMTKKWLCQTPTPPRIPIFYTLTKIHKPTPVGRPIISGCDGQTEKLSCFVDKILQPIAQQQKSLKDKTDFINFIEKTKLPKGIILVSMDVTSLYTNIPQEEGINLVCTAYETSYNETPPTPKPLPSTLTLRWSLKKDEHRQRCLQKLLFYSIFGVAFMCIISKIKRPFRGDRINAKGIVTNLFKSFLAGVWLNRLVSFSDYTLRYCIRFIWLVRLTFYDTSMET